MTARRKPVEWRCFHCGDSFESSPSEARRQRAERAVVRAAEACLRHVEAACLEKLWLAVERLKRGRK